MAFDPSEWQFETPVVINSASIPANMPDGGESLFPADFIIKNGGPNWEGDAANIFPRVNTIANDIAFTLPDRSTQLRHTITDWNAAGGSELMVARIGIPSIASAVDTPAIMWSRDDGAADQQQTVYLAADNWQGYWPLQEEVAGAGNAGAYVDITDNTNDGLDDVDATGQTGQVGAGQQFTAPDVISVPHHASLAIAGNLTVGCWFNFSVTHNNDPMVAKWGGGELNYVLTVDWTTNNKIAFAVYVGATKAAKSASTYSDGAWHYAVGRYDGSNALLYIDGGTEDVTGDATAGPLTTGTGELNIGDYSTGAGAFTGYLDEAFVRDTDCSDNWLKTMHNCQKRNGDFWTVGSETAVGGGPIIGSSIVGSKIIGSGIIIPVPRWAR